jgi:hypothetical protein
VKVDRIRPSGATEMVSGAWGIVVAATAVVDVVLLYGDLTNFASDHRETTRR